MDEIDRTILKGMTVASTTPNELTQKARLDALVKAGFAEIYEQALPFPGREPHRVYRITELGRSVIADPEPSN